MNKKLLIIVVAIGVLLVAGIAYVVANRTQKTDTPDQTTSADQAPAEEQTVAPEDTPTQSIPGAYKNYSESEVAATKGTKVLFFHAQWCPQCRQLDAEITTGPLPENVTIFKVNYDTSQALRQKYGVTLQTTFVKIDDAGNLVKKYVAYDEPTLAALIRNIL